MILIWLGSYFLSLIAGFILISAFGGVTAGIARRLLNYTNRNGFWKSFVPVTLLGALDIGPSLVASEKAVVTGEEGPRKAMLLHATSFLDFIIPWIFGLFILQFSGLLVVGFVFLLILVVAMCTTWFNPVFLRRFKMGCYFFLALGAFSFAAELTIKNFSILVNALQDFEVSYLLSDGRWFMIAWMMAKGFIFSWMLSFAFCRAGNFAVFAVSKPNPETPFRPILCNGWSLWISIILILTGMFSINGALGMFAGERLYRSVRIPIWGLKLCSCAGVLIGLALALFLKSENFMALNFGETFSLATGDSRRWVYQALVLLIDFGQFAGAMGWGHISAVRAKMV